MRRNFCSSIQYEYPIFKLCDLMLIVPLGCHSAKLETFQFAQKFISLFLQGFLHKIDWRWLVPASLQRELY